MGSVKNKNCRTLFSRVRRTAIQYFSCSSALFAVAGLPNAVFADSSQGSASLSAGWVLFTVLGILAVGLWLQSSRQRLR